MKSGKNDGEEGAHGRESGEKKNREREKDQRGKGGK